MRTLICFSFLFSGVSEAAATPLSTKSLSAIAGFLSDVDSGRSSAYGLEMAKSEYEVAIDQEKKDATVYKMTENLFRRAMVSEDQFREAKANWEVAQALSMALRERVVWLEHSVRVDELSAEISAGKALDAKKLYNEYLAKWKAGCRARSGEAAVEKSKLELAQFRAETGRVLYKKKVLAFQDYLDREHEYNAAAFRYQRAQRLDSGCGKGIPTPDDIEDVSLRNAP